MNPERVIRELLADINPTTARFGADTAVRVLCTGVLAPSNVQSVRSPETYVGYARSARLVSTQRIRRDSVATYAAPRSLAVNGWAFNGSWKVTREYGVSAASGAAISFRFHARDLHLVLGTAAVGARVKFRVTVDGHPPGPDAGVDVDANGNGVIAEHRLYQLVRQSGTVRDRTFVVTFEGPGAQAYSFTFG